MPRKAREKSETGIYHCVIRGIDKQDIFFDNSDRRKFLKEIAKTKEKYGYELYAYCLMDNHIHLMIKDCNEKLYKIMQSIMISYSSYFNKKYDRTGHLFQNRYLSKPVENERYLLVLQRYIHQNPTYMKTFFWSSYKEYVQQNEITDTKFVLELFSSKREEAIKEFVKFNDYRKEKIDGEKYKDYELISTISDSEAIRIISDILKVKNILEIKRYNVKIRENYIKKILKIKGINGRQIARILQVDKKIIERIQKKGCVPAGDNCPQGETSPKEERNG